MIGVTSSRLRLEDKFEVFCLLLKNLRKNESEEGSQFLKIVL